MKMMLCDNVALDNKVRELNIRNIKEYLSNNMGYHFEEQEVGEDIIYTYEIEENYVCLRTVKGFQDPEAWICSMTAVIDQFCELYPEGYIVLHLGIGGMSKTNFYNYPSIRAIMNSKVSENRVIVYTTNNISEIIFHEETNSNYKLIGGTQVDFVMGKVLNYMND